MLLVEGYRPFIRVELPDHASTYNDAENLRSKIAKRYSKSIVTLEMEKRKRFYGWIPEKNSTKTREFTYALFRFSNFQFSQSATYFIETLGFKVTDKQVRPLSKFMNELKLSPADWIEIINPIKLDTKIQRISNCQLEFSSRISSIIHKPRDAIAPLLVLSFDGEMYSNDGAFPNTLKGDFTIFIGASFWTFGKKEIKRIVLGVGDIIIPETTD
jgi:DNA polymerase elongation subunit (family B)